MAAEPGSTLIELVNAVAQSVGHPKTTEVASSQDEAILRIAYYVNIACQELLYMYQWQFLSKTSIIPIEADTPNQKEKAFDLPVDWKAMTDDTMWDRSTQLPAIGPVNPQDWQWLVVRNTYITTRMLWRIRDKKLWIKSPPPPGSPQDFSFEYVSRYWAIDGVTAEPKDKLTNNSDYALYPWQLVMLFTRAKWFENEGYDSSGAYLDFQKAFAYETGTDKGATALNLVPGTGYPYINAIKNIPDTGYGSSS
jgi:hypothetical protein